MQDYSARCHVCGAALAPDAAYCGSCGSQRVAAPAQPPAPSQTPAAAPGWPASQQDVAAQTVPPSPPPPSASEAQPSYPPAPSISAPLPNPYGQPEQPAPAMPAPPAPTAPGGYPAATGPANPPSGAFAPPPPAYTPPPPAPGAYASGQYLPPPPPGYGQPGQMPPPGYPQSGQLPPPAYAVPGYGQPVYLQVQQQSTSGPIIAEVILGLFGIFGVGWLIGGKTTTGAILLGLSALWWITSIVSVVFTFGLGALCIYPIDIAFIVASAVLLNNALKQG